MSVFSWMFKGWLKSFGFLADFITVAGCNLLTAETME